MRALLVERTQEAKANSEAASAFSKQVAARNGNHGEQLKVQLEVLACQQISPRPALGLCMPFRGLNKANVTDLCACIETTSCISGCRVGHHVHPEVTFTITLLM